MMESTGWWESSIKMCRDVHDDSHMVEDCAGNVFGLTRATKALVMMELLLMSTVLTLYTKDHWVQYLIDWPVILLPGLHCRLLPISVLLSLSRSEVGIKCRSQWFGGKWRGVLSSNIDDLSLKTYFSRKNYQH